MGKTMVCSLFGTRFFAAPLTIMHVGVRKKTKCILVFFNHDTNKTNNFNPLKYETIRFFF